MLLNADDDDYASIQVAVLLSLLVFYKTEKLGGVLAKSTRTFMTWSYSPRGYVNKIVLWLQMQAWERWSCIQIHQESLQLVWKIIRKQFSYAVGQHMKKGLYNDFSLIQREI